MKVKSYLLAAVLGITSCMVQAEETLVEENEVASTEQATQNLDSAYISDDLFIYMHAGAGNNYRILGSINAGDEIKVTGNQENGYTEIIDPKGRKTWVEDKYVSNTPGLRFVIAELNTKLASNDESNQQVYEELNQAKSYITNLESNATTLEKQILSLNEQLASTKSQLTNQDLELKKEYFFNGAIVLAIGLLLGVVLPRISMRKRSNMESWK